MVIVLAIGSLLPSPTLLVGDLLFRELLGLDA
jgi:hypothetical protein